MKFKRVLSSFLTAAIALSTLWSFGLIAMADTENKAEEISVDTADTEESGEDAAHFDFFDITTSYSSVLYNATNGLPTSEANAITQTSDGFIWIGGYSGLIRYDGSNFVRYDSSYGIASVICLYVDDKDVLWIGTNDGGVASLYQGDITFYTMEDGINSSSVRAITQDLNGNMIIATTEGVNYITPEGEVYDIDDERINSLYIVELRVGRNGEIYCLSTNGDLFILKDLQVSEFYSGDTFEHTLSCVCPDTNNSGYVYLGTDDNIIYYGELSTLNFKETIVDPLYTVTEINMVDDYIIMISDNGIGVLNYEGNFKKLENIDMTNSIDDMCVDFEGDLWFASSRQGVMKVVENRFTDITMIAGLEEMVVNATCYDEGLIYLGTDTGVYALDEEYNLVENSVTEAVNGARTRAILKDREGNIWFCTYGDNALVEYTTSHEIVTFCQDDGLLANKTRDIYEASDGTYYVSASIGVNAIRDGEVTDTVYDGNDGLLNTSILTICEDFDNNIMLGSDGDGIYVFDGDEMVDHITQEDGLNSNVILRIKRDDVNNVLWIITSNSLAYIQDGVVTTINNFPYSNNLDIMINENNEAWVLSSSGLYRLNVEELLANNEDMDYVLYDSRRGLTRSVTANSRNYEGEDGTLYISCSSGIVTMNIEDDFYDGSRVMLAIPYVMCDGVYYYPDNKGTITIPSSTVRLTIYGYVLSYSFDFPKVGYTLSGLDSETVYLDIDELSALSYTNLDGGTYTFELSVVNVSTHEKEKTLTVTVIKEKAYWEQWWFKVLATIIAVALLVLIAMVIFHIKTQQLLKQRERDKRIFKEVVSALARIIDAKDQYTRGHSFRVAKYSQAIARGMGFSEDKVDEIYNIALLHDVGKTGIPIAILNKPGRLTDEEFQIIKSHTTIGRGVLDEIKDFPELSLGAAYHHEKYDGSGYPEGLKGDQIPQIARIIAVADSFDAMYSTRPYRKQMPLEKVLAEIEKCKGTQFDPEVADVFIHMVRNNEIDLEQIQKEVEAQNILADTTEDDPAAKKAEAFLEEASKKAAEKAKDNSESKDADSAKASDDKKTSGESKSDDKPTDSSDGKKDSGDKS